MLGRAGLRHDMPCRVEPWGPREPRAGEGAVLIVWPPGVCLAAPPPGCELRL